MGTLLRALLVSAALLSGRVDAAASERYALLVGATEYVNAPRLNGPRNDVVLMYDVLTSFGFKKENIIVMADSDGHDGVRRLSDGCVKSVGPLCPTYDNIASALMHVRDRLEMGDFFYFHFSGHGMKVPARDVISELDGLDEAILPIDFGAWDDESKEVANTITDDDVAAAFDGVLNKGTSMFVVFDACDTFPDRRYGPAAADAGVSAPVNRGVSPRSARVPLSYYGSSVEEAEENPRSILSGEDAVRNGEGRFSGYSIGRMGYAVYFQASRYGRPAIETNFKGHGSRESDRIGLFTFAIQKVLAESIAEGNVLISYDELASRVIDIYESFGIDDYAPHYEASGEWAPGIAVFP